MFVSGVSAGSEWTSHPKIGRIAPKPLNFSAGGLLITVTNHYLLITIVSEDDLKLLVKQTHLINDRWPYRCIYIRLSKEVSSGWATFSVLHDHHGRRSFVL